MITSEINAFLAVWAFNGIEQEFMEGSVQNTAIPRRRSIKTRKVSNKLPPNQLSLFNAI